MKTYFDCYPCFLRQALKAARLSGANEAQLYSVLQSTLSVLQNLPSNATPPEIGYKIHKIVREAIDTQDPYDDVKKISTQKALALYPRLKAMVRQSKDPLATAIRLSIAGNIIDFAMSDQIADLWSTVERVVKQPYAIDDREALKECMKNADHVFYLADNAGETVFDRVLIEELPLPVIYAVKGGPILNDAIMQDALAAGLDSCATIISNGSQAPGTILSLCSSSFREQFNNATLIIAKGQANYESLSNAGTKIFCVLQVKCPVIASDLEVTEGSIVVRQSVSR